MQTRRAAKAAAHAATAPSPRIRLSMAAAVTPSPPRKKARALHNSSTKSREMSFSEIREEMLCLIHSRLVTPDEEGSGSNRADIETGTLGGWCLVDGLTHCATKSDDVLNLIREHGPPNFYMEHLKSKNRPSCMNGSSDFVGDYESFRSLCRIVAGQQLAGNAAKTIWCRLLNVVSASEENASNLTPERVLSIVESGDIEADLRAPAGLSKAKCNCIVAIATSFRDGNLSDKFLLGGEATDDEVRSRLLSIKGLGPWSVDMFLLFQCHRSNILPIGDLAFRNGTSKLWNVKGHAKGGGLCPKKDEQLVKDMHSSFTPYRSISSYYMYKCSGMK
ncbi:hypothetical protein ACHAWF_007357 [Thalassiosira exigua]